MPGEVFGLKDVFQIDRERRVLIVYYSAYSVPRILEGLESQNTLHLKAASLPTDTSGITPDYSSEETSNKMCLKDYDVKRHARVQRRAVNGTDAHNLRTFMP
jgi:hypothetical protein